MINKLPDIILQLIFTQLDLINLIKSRFVCKAWWNLIEKKVIIVQMVIGFDHEPWFYTKQPINMKRLINLNPHADWPIFAQRLMNLQFLKNLKQLRIRFSPYVSGANNINNLINYFYKLEQFEFNSSRIGRLMICHSNIKIISSWNIHDTELEFNCPKLFAFDYWGCFKNCRILNPQTFQYLELYEYSDRFKINFSEFKNLNILKINKISKLNNQILDELIKLKKLIITKYIGENQENLIMINLIERKQALNREIQIFIRDIEIKDINHFNKIKGQLKATPKSNATSKSNLKNYYNS